MKKDLVSGLILVAGLSVIFFLFNQKPRIAEEADLQVSESYLHIPKISITAPVVFVESTDEGTIQEGLQKGVVHYAGSAELGEVGNSYIIGHSSDYPDASGEYKAIFSRLPELAVGDEIIILDESQVIYRVIEKRVVEDDDLSVLSQTTEGKRLLTLQTSYPIGSSAKRLVIISELK